LWRITLGTGDVIEYDVTDETFEELNPKEGWWRPNDERMKLYECQLT